MAIIRELECQTNSDDENRDPADAVAAEEMLYAAGEGEVVDPLVVASPSDLDMCLEVETGHQHNSIHG